MCYMLRRALQFSFRLTWEHVLVCCLLFVYIYIYIYMYRERYIYIHTYAYTYVYSMFVCMSLCICVFLPHLGKLTGDRRPERWGHLL